MRNKFSKKKKNDLVFTTSVHFFDFLVHPNEIMILWNTNHITTKPLDFFKWDYHQPKDESNKILALSKPICGTVVTGVSFLDN